MPALRQVIDRLEECGANIIGVASFTTHMYYDGFAADRNAPVLNLVSATVDTLKDRGATSVAVVGAGASREAKLLEKYLPADLQTVMPSTRVQAEVDALIAGVKRLGATQELRNGLDALLAAKWLAGADATLICCTDLSPLLSESRDGTLCVSDVLVDALNNYRPHPRSGVPD